jgi:hypothetical protein
MLDNRIKDGWQQASKMPRRVLKVRRAGKLLQAA